MAPALRTVEVTLWQVEVPLRPKGHFCQRNRRRLRAVGACASSGPQLCACASSGPQLCACASSGRARRLWAARHSQGEVSPLDAQPRPPKQPSPPPLNLQEQSTDESIQPDQPAGDAAGSPPPAAGPRPSGSGAPTTMAGRQAGRPGLPLGGEGGNSLT